MAQVITPQLAAVPASTEQTDAFKRAQSGSTLLSVPLPGFTPAGLWGGYTPPPYLVRDMLGPSELTVLFAMSGHFKSVIAIDLALSVGLGFEFHGMKARRTGVLYVAGEGHAGIRKRARAWMLARDLSEESEQPAVYFTTAGTDLMNGYSRLKETVGVAAKELGTEIGLVVIDTLAANRRPVWTTITSS